MRVQPPVDGFRPEGLSLDKWVARAFLFDGVHYYVESDLKFDNIWRISPKDGSVAYNCVIAYTRRRAINLWKHSSFSETMPIYLFLQQVLGEK